MVTQCASPSAPRMSAFSVDPHRGAEWTRQGSRSPGCDLWHGSCFFSFSMTDIHGYDPGDPGVVS